MAVGTRFIDRSREFLKTNYLPKIEAAVRPLSPADVWWRPNDASNASGHLLLHLTGNVRQWIVALLHEYPLRVGRRGPYFSGPSAGVTLQG